MPLKLTVQPVGGPQGGGVQKPTQTPIRPVAPAQSSPSTGGATASWAAFPPHAPSSGTSLPPHSPHVKPAARNPPPTILPQVTTASPQTHAQQQPQHQTLKPSSSQQQPPAKDITPDAPPHSPITPPLHPIKTVTPIPPPTIPPNFASMGGRAPLTYTAHPPIVASAPPAPVSREPIDFENNPDVIALQATVGILLQQKKRAEEDLRKLKNAKSAAMERPLEFARDLMGGRVSQGPVTTEEDEDSDGDEDCDVDMKIEDDGGDTNSPTGTGTTTDGLKPSALRAKDSMKGKGKATSFPTSSNRKAASTTPPPWANLPKPQDIARMPPINWTQYAVEGEALNKLHNHQLTHPTLGTPAVMGANGTYEFTGAANPDDGKRLVGITAPFDPLRDRIVEKKPKGSSRRGA